MMFRHICRNNASSMNNIPAVRGSDRSLCLRLVSLMQRWLSEIQSRASGPDCFEDAEELICLCALLDSNRVVAEVLDEADRSDRDPGYCSHCFRADSVQCVWVVIHEGLHRFERFFVAASAGCWAVVARVCAGVGYQMLVDVPLIDRIQLSDFGLWHREFHF